MDRPAESVTSAAAELQTARQWSVSIILAGILLLIFVADRIMTPRMEQQEPPLLKPTVPWIGHIVGLIQKSAGYFMILRDKHRQSAATLPMLRIKTYVIFDPTLAQAALRSSSMSGDDLQREFIKMALSDDKEALPKALSPTFLSASQRAVHGGFGGSSLSSMNQHSIDFIAEFINAIGDEGQSEPNMYLWIRTLITRASLIGLFGRDNPLENNLNLESDLWVYEPAQASLVVLPFPSITVPRGYRAMRKLQEVFATYYEEERHMKNPDCAEFVRRNAIAAEDGGMTRRHVGILNFSLAGAAIMNTAPSVYWMICTIFSRKDLLQRVRQELLQKVDRDGSAATLDISRVEAECPLLVSCYREMMRLLSQFVIARKVVEDTTLRDGKGNSYLFKKGAMVQVPTAASHHSGDAWGDSVEEFDPDRFMPSNVDKSKRTAYFPFGGGRHLCPGRQFAFMETLALTAALVVGFEVMPTGKGWDGVKPAGAVLGASVLKPERDGEGQGVMVWRREGWEDVTWKFTT